MFFQAAQLGSSHPIVFDFEGIDVWVIPLHISYLTEQDMYKKKSENVTEFYNCPSLFSEQDKACATLGVYIFTGCDTIEGFFGLLNVRAMKRILQPNNMTHLQIVQQLGIDEELSDELFLQLQLFTIRIIYNDPVNKRLCKAQVHKWRQL